MVQYNQLPIYRDTYWLLTEIYQTTGKFPRDYKYTLGQDMKRDCLSLFQDLYMANFSVAPRRPPLAPFFPSFALLKVEICLCVDFTVLSVHQLAQLRLVMDNIARQAAAWRKKSK